MVGARAQRHSLVVLRPGSVLESHVAGHEAIAGDS